MSTPTASVITINTQKVTVEAEYKSLITGFNTVLAGLDPVEIADTAFHRADLLAKFQKRIDASEQTKAARAALRTQVAAEKAVAKEVEPLRLAVKTYLQGRFGKQSPKLQAFGFAEAKTPQKSAASKANAVTKGKATRKARSTMGKKQRKAIKAPSTSTTPEPAAGSTPANTTPGPAPGVATAKPAVPFTSAPQS